MVLRGHQGRINDAQFSRDDVFLVTAGADGSSRVWAIMPPEEGVKELRGHSESVMSTAYSPDGSLALTASADGTARLWQMPNGERLDPALSHDGPVLSAIFSPDGKSVLTVTRERIATVWDVSSRQHLNATQLQQPACPPPTFSPDGKLVIGAVEGNIKRIWSASTGQEVARIPVERHSTLCEIQFTADSKALITMGTDGGVRVWPIGSAQPSQSLVLSMRNVRTAAFSADGALMAAAGKDNAIQVWNIARRKNLFELPASEKTIRSLAFSPDKTLMLAIGDDPTVRVWEIGAAKPEVLLNLRTPPPPAYGAIYQRAAEFSRDGRLVLSSNSDENFVQVWRATGLPLVDFGASNFGDHIATFSPDGKLVMIAKDASAKIYKCELCGSLDSLIALARARATRNLSDAERKQYLGLFRFILK
jgi:WD40 repeat protein